MTDVIEAAPLEPYALYRYFDVRDILLYIGISGDLAIRSKSHIASSRWMQLTAWSTVERHKTLADVSSAEREAIKSEQPLFNERDNNTPEAKERLRAYLEEIGRLDLLSPPERRPKPSREELTDGQIWFREMMIGMGCVEGLPGCWSRSVRDIPLEDRGMGDHF
jgi:hypothetical protein